MGAEGGARRRELMAICHHRRSASSALAKASSLLLHFVLLLARGGASRPRPASRERVDNARRRRLRLCRSRETLLEREQKWKKKAKRVLGKKNRDLTTTERKKLLLCVALLAPSPSLPLPLLPRSPSFSLCYPLLFTSDKDDLAPSFGKSNGAKKLLSWPETAPRGFAA